MLVDPDQAERNQADIDRSWYALYTRHHHEKSIARTLTAKGFTIFLPFYDIPRQWKDRTKIVSLPLFSCYVFIQGGLHRQLDVVTTPGICGFVCSAGVPAAIPAQEIEGIRQAVERCVKIEPHPFIHSGDRVRVTTGPLEGIEGILVRKKNFSRLVLTVDLLGKSAAVEVDVTTVERIPSRGKSRTPHLAGEMPLAYAHGK